MKTIVKAVVISLIAGVLLSGCATVPITGRRQLVLISNAELNTMSKDNYRRIIGKSRLSDNKEAVRIKVIGKDIARSAESFLQKNGMSSKISGLAWEFNVIESETANAFAMPGGKVAVYNGILKYTQSDDGIAVVIAHEIAHVIANHGAERMSQMMLAQFGHNLIAEALEEKSQITQEFLMLAYGVSMNLGIVLPFSRLHETEADRIGLILMSQAGYNPREAVYFWNRMNDAHKGDKNLEFLSTHPAPQTRIEDIKAFLPEALKYQRQ